MWHAYCILHCCDFTYCSNVISLYEPVDTYSSISLNSYGGLYPGTTSYPGTTLINEPSGERKTELGVPGTRYLLSMYLPVISGFSSDIGSDDHMFTDTDSKCFLR